jgi:hypothetical protein
MAVDTEVVALPLPNDFDFIGKAISEHGIVGPHTRIYPIPESEAEVSDAAHKDVENSRSAVYVYGRLDYIDGFGQKHWTDFCQWYGLFTPTVAGLCNMHNDGDRE